MMRAVPVESVVFPAPGICEIQLSELTTDLGPHEVLIVNRLGLISPGTELAMFGGTHPGFGVEGHHARYPYFPGYAGVGAVVGVGARVTGLDRGTRVFHQANHCTATKQPDWMVLPAGDLADERAVFLKLLGIALTAHLVAPITPGDSAHVLGLGLVGNLAAQLCAELGARPVTAVDPSPARVERARACGIDARVDGDRIDAAYVIEAAGTAAALRAAFDATAPDGRLVILSSPRETFALDPYADIMERGLHVIGAHEWRRTREQRAPFDAFLHDLLASRRVAVDPLVTHRVLLRDAAGAYAGLRDDPGEWLGVLLEHPG
jgi:2-desacetyl-2-hydroxyethyl bacteriochlorophyllide A dehydrogenase